MNRSSLRALSALATLVLAGAATAQLATYTLPAGIGSDPRSVHLLPTGHVVISNQVDGWQHFVDVTVPTSPTLTTSYNPPFGDQWFEAEYTPMWNGRLFTAHRGGGLNMIDVSNPSAPVTVASVPTAYHFRGLRFLPTPVGNFLYYNETNSGLQVWDVNSSGTTLTPGWNNFAANNDGNGLEILGRHIYQYGTPASSPTTRVFKAFDLFAPLPSTPLQVFSNSSGSPVSGNGHVQLRKHSISGVPRMLASRYYDGLDLVDCTVPASPVSINIIPANPQIVVWGSRFFPSSTVSVTYGTVFFGTVQVHWWLFLSIPPSGAPGFIYFGIAPMDIHDIVMDPSSPRIYVVGRDSATHTQGLLQVY